MGISFQTGLGMGMKFEINGNGNILTGLGVLTAFSLTL